MKKFIIWITITSILMSLCGCGTPKEDEPTVARAEFAQMLVENIVDENTVKEIAAFLSGNTIEINDVSEQDAYYPYIAYLISGGKAELDNSGNFNGNNQIDRETAVVWTVKILGLINTTEYSFNDDADITNKKDVYAAVENELVDYSRYFYPQNLLTQSEASEIIIRATNLYQSFNSLRESPNIVKFLDDIVSLTSSDKNILIEENGNTYIFNNISDEVKNLSKGDKFVIEPCSNIPSGIAIKVSNININGNSAEITADTNTSFDDFIDEIDVAEKVNLTMDMLDKSTLPEGVTVEEIPTTENSNISASGLSYSNNAPELSLLYNKTSNDTNLEQTATYNIFNKKKFTIKEVKIGDLTVNGDVIFDDWSVTCDILHNSIIPDGFKVKLDTDSTINVSANYGVKNSFEKGKGVFTATGKNYKDFWHESIIGEDDFDKDFNDYKVGLGEWSFPVASVIVVKIKAYLKVEAEGNISIAISQEIKTEQGVQCQLSKMPPQFISKSDPKTDIAVVADGILKAGLNGEVSASVLNLGGVALDLGFGVGAIANIEENKNNSIHLCKYCMDGDGYFYGEVALEPVILGKEKQGLNKIFKKKFLDFYYSFDTGQGGFGECPNKAESNSKSEDNTTNEQESRILDKLTASKWYYMCSGIDETNKIYEFNNNYTYSITTLNVDMKKETGTYKIENDEVIFGNFKWKDGKDKLFYDGHEGFYNITSTGVDYTTGMIESIEYADEYQWIFCPECGSYALMIKPFSWVCQNGHNLAAYPDSPLFLCESEGMSNDNNNKKNEFIGKASHIEQFENEIGKTATDQSSMNRESAEIFQKWDDLLNEIYQYLKSTLPQNEFSMVQTEQIQWIKDKEAAVEATGQEYAGGSMEPMQKNGVATDYTRERCYQLIEMIK